MQLQKVSLQNFRCFDEIVVEFSPQFNVIIGNNGTGKSSLMEGLCMVLSAFFGGLDEASPRRFQNNDSRYITLDEKPAYQFPVSFSALGKVNQQEVSWAASRKGKNKPTSSKDTSQIRDIAKNLQNQLRKGERVELPVIAYFGAHRLSGIFDKENKEEELINIENQSRLSIYHNALRPTANYEHIKDWFKSKELAAMQAKMREEPDLYDAKVAKKAVVSCIENCEDIYFDLRQSALLMKMSDGRIIRWNNLSDGQRAVLAVVLEIAYMCVNLNPHLKENALNSAGVVLIDELDMHLHPKWQRSIVEDLKRTFPNIQFIVTTHSPFIVQNLKDEELIVLDGNKDNYDDPKDLPLNKIATEIMQVSGIRSDDFEKRHKIALSAFQQLQKNKNPLLLQDYNNLKDFINGLVVGETNDPVYKAFLEASKK